MAELAFVILAFMVAMYVMLDGYDLGSAAVAPFVAYDRAERGAAMEAIGPFWNGNEVWLIATGGVLFALFPRAYAAAFSGFYLPFMIVLWLLMVRGIALEVRGHFENELWHNFWDAAFAWSSALLIFVFGIAIGNLVRGLPLGAGGFFFGTFAYLLNPYALGVGVLAVVVLAQHGAVFLHWRGDGRLRAASRHLAVRLWWVVLILCAGVTSVTLAIKPGVMSRPWLFVLVFVSLAALWSVRRALLRDAAANAFIASCVFIVALLAAAAATIYPFLLPSFPNASDGLTIFQAATSEAALSIGLVWTVIGLILVLCYTYATIRKVGRSR
jgi:cytochrome d ubiquinol oxidase subunit II